MKKSIKIGLIIVIFITILITAMIFVFSNIKIKTSLNNQESSYEQITDENILTFLKENNIINSNDIYITYDRDIGIFGPEGDKRYIYKRENESYYYVEISPLSYTSEGEYWGYTYNANEVFYKIDIQDCNYNEDAEYMDEYISDIFGDISYYIISGSKNNFKLMSVAP